MTSQTHHLSDAQRTAWPRSTDWHPTLLDLFCGEGGAGAGYARAGWKVLGVDNDAARLRRYPFPSIKADALTFLARFGHLFDAIHASPPCTGYTQATSMLPDRIAKYTRLIPATRDLLEASGRTYVIENVVSKDTRAELRNPTMLCWSHFYEPGTVEDRDGTPLWMRRHRLFETNSPTVNLIGAPSLCWHPKTMQCAGAYGGARRDPHEARHVRRGGYVPHVDVMRCLLDTHWMSEKGCQLSIPPAYTAWIGDLLMQEHLGGEGPF